MRRMKMKTVGTGVVVCAKEEEPQEGQSGSDVFGARVAGCAEPRGL